MNPSERLLTRGDERIPLRPKTFALLVILVGEAGRLLGKDELLREIWDDAVVEEGNLNRTVSELRKALGDMKDEPRLIETVPRVGYRFIAPVTKSGREAPAELPVAATSTPAPGSAKRKSSRLLFVGGIAVAVLVVLTAAAGWYFYGRAETKSRFGEKRVATGQDDANSAVWISNSALRFMTVSKDNRYSLFEIDVDTPAAPRPASHVSPDGKFMLITDDARAGRMYVANADGSNKRQLPFVFGNSGWSRTSPEIVVQFFPDGKREASDIAIINLETLEWKNLTNSATFDADPSFSPDAAQIAFTSTRDGNAEIYLMDRDGGNVRRLTNSPAWESFAAFSPDGTQLSFNSDRDRELNNVYILDLDGSGRERSLPRGDWRNFTGNGFWSPDGTRIAYSSDRGEREELYVRDAELEAPREILADSGADLMMPFLSRDGGLLAFVAKLSKDKFEIRVLDRRSGSVKVVRTVRELTRVGISPDNSTFVFQEKIGDNTEVCAVDANGGNFRNLSNNASFDAAPEFSPDGSRIVFVSNRGGRGEFDVFIMNADGGDQHIVSEAVKYGTTLSATWSVDGREIIFANDREGGGNGNFELFSVPATGGEVSRMISNPRAADDSPAVSTRDGRVAFQSLSRGNSEIYVTGKDKSFLRVTRNLADDREPVWNEDGSKIIFSSNRGGRFALYEVAP